jgi:two-component system NtrC family sensor kinase
VLFAIAVVSVALIIGIYFSRFVTGPLRNLEKVMGRVSRGELGVELPPVGQSEVGTVVSAFNTMSKELQRHSEELDSKNAQLVQQEKLSAIGELSAGLAHEVKNPMVGIVGFAQLGQESTNLAEAKEYFQLIDSDARRANGILQNLLEFARPPDVTLEKLEVNPVVQGAVRLCAHQLQLQGVKLEASYGDQIPPIEGNGNQLRQVLLNLMMNAQQAMEQSKEKKLYVTTTAQNGSVTVLVRDTGPGMPPEVQKHIFEPFFTTKVRGKGTGLGLSVSASIVSAHKGKIQVESSMGQGTTFKIELPALKS